MYLHAGLGDILNTSPYCKWNEALVDSGPNATGPFVCKPDVKTALSNIFMLPVRPVCLKFPIVCGGGAWTFPAAVAIWGGGLFLVSKLLGGKR